MDSKMDATSENIIKLLEEEKKFGLCVIFELNAVLTDIMQNLSSKLESILHASVIKYLRTMCSRYLRLFRSDIDRLVTKYNLDSNTKNKVEDVYESPIRALIFLNFFEESSSSLPHELSPNDKMFIDITFEYLELIVKHFIAVPPHVSFNEEENVEEVKKTISKLFEEMKKIEKNERNKQMIKYLEKALTILKNHAFSDRSQKYLSSKNEPKQR